MKLLLFSILTLLYAINLTSSETSFIELVDSLNITHDDYSDLSPFHHSYFPLSELKLSQEEIDALVKENKSSLRENKDSIEIYTVIEYYQTKLIYYIEKVLSHRDLNQHELDKLIKSSDLSVVISDDRKLYNISFDERTGGTYRSRTSIMYYTELDESDSAAYDELQYFFESDGYNEIYTLETNEGVKYLLTGSVRGCSYCFETFVRLVSFQDKYFENEFEYRVSNRDWSDGVFYNPETKTINVDYHVDDLTSYCSCSEENMTEFDYQSYEEKNQSINCKCKFIFNGTTFELVEESWKRIDNEEREKNR